MQNSQTACPFLLTCPLLLHHGDIVLSMNVSLGRPKCVCRLSKKKSEIKPKGNGGRDQGPSCLFLAIEFVEHVVVALTTLLTSVV